MWRREEQVCAEKFSELRMRIKRGKKRKARKEWEPKETRGAECKNKGKNIIIVFTVQKNQNKKRRSICWLCVSNIHVEWKISQNNTQYMYVSIHTHSVCACTKEIYLCTHTHTIDKRTKKTDPKWMWILVDEFVENCRKFARILRIHKNQSAKNGFQFCK